MTTHATDGYKFKLTVLNKRKPTGIQTVVLTNRNLGTNKMTVWINKIIYGLRCDGIELTKRFQITFLALPWDFWIEQNYSTISSDWVFMPFVLVFSCTFLGRAPCILLTIVLRRPADFVHVTIYGPEQNIQCRVLNVVLSDSKS